MIVKNLDEATHVGAFEFMRQIDRHLQDCHGVLLLVIAIKDDDRIPKTGDADPV
jgi:hypothetical protein